jgi:peptidoglycan/xylan/chitin deacetylase (PgdA/CDA1 family)
MGNSGIRGFYGSLHYSLKPENILRLVHPEIVWRLPFSDKKVIALTFDDGPTPLETPRILDILRKHDVTATFFLDGQNLVTNPEIIETILKDGHTLGNHSTEHIPPLLIGLSNFVNQLLQFEQMMKNHGFPIPTLYRPPNGIMTGSQLRYAQSRGYRVVMGDVYPRDAQGADADVVASRVINDIQPGSIIILHAGVPGNQRRTLPFNTPEALEIMLPQLLDEGYKFVDIEKYLSNHRQ